ncbi:restriction endonuclease subunit S [Prevotella copri]|uniref:restriction endonuclease subunit S n=1 Tax=Segatella copri TaxID=165179 RepID=UPI00030CEB0D|nr:restriction endonuclease subunit S [Segatella copri]
MWTTVGEITNYGDSVNVQVEDIDNSDWVLELEDIEKDTAKIIQHLNKNERKINGTRHKFQKGQILYSKLRTYLNKVLVAPNDGFCTTEIMAFGSYGILSNNYICYVLRSLYFLDYTLQCGYGVKMPRLSTTDACNGLIPLPPLAEQERIVNEIQRLFSIIDIVENGKDGLQTAIQQAKNKILDHAIHGKLVPQDPNDEPASELLKRINPKAEITCDNPQYGKLPKGWCETTLGNTIVIKSGDAIKVRDNRIGKYPIYGGNGITGYNESYNVDGINIIIGRVGFYCGSVHYVNNKIWVTDNAFVTKIMGNVYTPKFLYYLLQQYDLQQYSNSTAQPVISGKTVYPINVMLPPLSEQYRIVAKIEELFSQLDKIESSLQA